MSLATAATTSPPFFFEPSMRATRAPGEPPSHAPATLVAVREAHAQRRYVLALAASLVVHALALPWLVMPAARSPAVASRGDVASLSIVLTPPAPVPSLAQPRQVTPDAPTAPAPVAHAEVRPPKPASEPAHATAPREPFGVSRTPLPGLPKPSVHGGVPFTVLGDAVFNRIISEFPVEVDTPVKLPDSLTVRYPRELAEGDSAPTTVILWIIVGADGVPEEMHLAQGHGAFAQAAIDALGAARYQPATIGGQPIRHHIAVAVDFPAAPSLKPTAHAANAR
jgi:outer membrane biosynthesis protein TonB